MNSALDEFPDNGTTLDPVSRPVFFGLIYAGCLQSLHLVRIIASMGVVLLVLCLGVG